MEKICQFGADVMMDEALELWLWSNFDAWTLGDKECSVVMKTEFIFLGPEDKENFELLAGMKI